MIMTQRSSLQGGCSGEQGFPMITCPQADSTVMEGVTTEGLRNAFRLALVLTGDSQTAEATLLDAIRSKNIETVSDASLLLEVVKKAVSLVHTRGGRTENIAGKPVLPLELRRLSRLTLHHRHCFALRILSGLSREECARLLHRDISQIEDGARAAMQELAIMRQEETTVFAHPLATHSASPKVLLQKLPEISLVT
jgi:hypothetical protein